MKKQLNKSCWCLHPSAVRCGWQLGLATAVVLAGAWSINSGIVTAQIVPDASLGRESSRVGTPLNSLIHQIDGGAVRGTNLFHSFEQFSVPTGQTAFFNNNLSIQNIFTRVTGGGISNIDGILKANGTANLFFLNPKGIIFGAGAQLNLGGSFLGTTASSIFFADGTEFSAINPTPPLLTVSVPVGLGFNGTEGNIVVNTGKPPSNTFTEQGHAGDSLITAQTVNNESTPLPSAIYGKLDNINDVNLYKVYLPANQPVQATTVGGTLVDTQLFLFNGKGLGLYANDDAAGTIQSSVPAKQPFTPAVSGYYYIAISSSGNNPLSKGGYIFNNALTAPTGDGAANPLSGWDNGGSDSGSYSIFLGNSLNSLNSAGLFVQPGKTLALVGGKVSLTGTLLRSPDSRIEIGGLAAPGIVGLNLDPSSASLKSLSFPNQGQRADVFISSSGRNGTNIDVSGRVGGSIAINARNLNILGDALAQNTLRTGIAIAQGSIQTTAGDINLNATDISLTASNIINSVTGTGNAGNIYINTGKLSIANFSQLSTRTDGQGNAGNLSITASDNIYFENSVLGSDVTPEGVGDGGDINISGRSLSLNSSQVRAQILGQGNGGNININVTSLTATNGSEITASTFGQGNAGKIDITASSSVGFDGSGIGPSGVFSGVRPGAVGDAGKINITAQNLSLTNDGEVSTSTRALGNGGDVVLKISDTIYIAGGSIFGSGIYSNSNTGSKGRGGSVSLQADTLRIEDGGQIAARSRTAFSGGNITANLNLLEITTGGQIFTTATKSGNAGDININATNGISISGAGADNGTTGIFANTVANSTGTAGSILLNTAKLTILDGASISVDSLGKGNGGNLTLRTADELILNRNGIVSASTTSGQGGNITLTAGTLQLFRGSLVSATAGNRGDGGNLKLNTNTLVGLDASNIKADAFQGKGGNIEITTQGVFLSPDSTITASSQQGINGVVQIRTLGFDVTNTLTPLTSHVRSTEQVIAGSCLARRNIEQGKFTVTGTGGLPTTPYDPFNGRYVLTGVQPLRARGNTNTTPHSSSSTPWKIGDAIVEAQGIVVLADGRTLLAASPLKAQETDKLICHPTEERLKS